MDDKYKPYNCFVKCNQFLVDWTAKAGCTTVKKIWFRSMGIPKDKLVVKKIEEGGKVVGCGVHVYTPTFLDKYGRVTLEDIKNPDYIKIKHVRNPYNRAVSSYIQTCKHPGMLGNFEKYNPTFYEFISLIHTRKMNINAGGGHWRIQNKHPDIVYDEIIKLENLNSELNRLSKKYNIDFKLQPEDQHSPHHVKKKNKIEHFYNVSASDIRKYLNETSNVPVYSSFYNDEIRELVYDIYKLDIDTYDYDFNVC